LEFSIFKWTIFISGGKRQRKSIYEVLLNFITRNILDNKRYNNKKQDEIEILRSGGSSIVLYYARLISIKKSS
jgi:hypothetical protein